MTGSRELSELRDELESINSELLKLLNRRARVVEQVRDVKARQGLPTHLPEREQAMLDQLAQANEGPFSDATIRHLFREIFRASVHHMEQGRRQGLIVGREGDEPRRVVYVGEATIGAEPVVIAGPCAIESKEQLEAVAEVLRRRGVPFIRGGAFKPRTSPYSFQGLGLDGLRLMADVAHRFGLKVVSEVTDPRAVEEASELVDVLQVGSRNMHNYDLLREIGRGSRPLLLKRGLAATVEELLNAAEYVALAGNEDIVLCERGIRTFARETRFTLDISAIPILARASRLPVIVDVSHAAGRRDILVPLARAALAAGAQGVMVEAHPWPGAARSDGQQQLDLAELEAFLDEVG